MASRHRHFDRQGNEITQEEFRSLFRPDYYRVARINIGSTLVSTIWLGVNHALFDNSPLEIFETVVVTNDPRYSGYTKHYATEAEAVAGHREVVRRIRGHLTLE
jgi:hypothetical protein